MIFCYRLITKIKYFTLYLDNMGTLASDYTRLPYTLYRGNLTILKNIFHSIV